MTREREESQGLLAGPVPEWPGAEEVAAGMRLLGSGCGVLVAWSGGGVFVACLGGGVVLACPGGGPECVAVASPGGGPARVVLACPGGGAADAFLTAPGAGACLAGSGGRPVRVVVLALASRGTVAEDPPADGCRRTA